MVISLHSFRNMKVVIISVPHHETWEYIIDFWSLPWLLHWGLGTPAAFFWGGGEYIADAIIIC